MAGLFPMDASLAVPTGVLRVWDLSSQKELYSQAIILSEGLAFSPDSRRIALGSATGKILVYEAASGKLLQSLAGHEGAVTSLAFSPDSKILASGGQDGTLRLWDLQAGKESRLLDQQSYDVRGSSLPARIGCIAISPDGNLLVTGDVGGMIRLYDMNTGVRVAAFPGHRGEVDTLNSIQMEHNLFQAVKMVRSGCGRSTPDKPSSDNKRPEQVLCYTWNGYTVSA